MPRSLLRNLPHSQSSVQHRCGAYGSPPTCHCPVLSEAHYKSNCFGSLFYHEWYTGGNDFHDHSHSLFDEKSRDLLVAITKPQHFFLHFYSSLFPCTTPFTCPVAPDSPDNYRISPLGNWYSRNFLIHFRIYLPTLGSSMNKIRLISIKEMICVLTHSHITYRLFTMREPHMLLKIKYLERHIFTKEFF